MDDEPILRKIFTQWLNMAGCKLISEASDGEAALAALQEKPFDVLISDVRMPVMDGFTLVRRLAELDLGVPSIIFVSGFADIDLRQMFEFGVEAFLSKPFKREELIACVETALADRSALWLNPMNPSPRQTLTVEVRDIDRSQKGDHTGPDSLSLGRGGFTVHALEPLAMGGVAFTCRLPAGTLFNGSDLCGEGYVRWFSRADAHVGIEFAYLNPSCRAWVVEEIDTYRPCCFIPGR